MQAQDFRNANDVEVGDIDTDYQRIEDFMTACNDLFDEREAYHRLRNSQELSPKQQYAVTKAVKRLPDKMGPHHPKLELMRERFWNIASQNGRSNRSWNGPVFALTQAFLDVNQCALTEMPDGQKSELELERP